MLKKILISLAAIVAIILVVAATRPDDFRVERSTTIAAAPATVFGHVNDFHRWQAWSPWEKLDPQLKRDFSGPTSGAGAVYAWAGNSDVGEGRMTITESRPAERVRINLEFIKPFEAMNTTEFVFKPQGSGTAVTWSMVGEHNFFSKVMCLFMDMDTMVGEDFERGLATLKAVSEGATKT